MATAQPRLLSSRRQRWALTVLQWLQRPWEGAVVGEASLGCALSVH